MSLKQIYLFLAILNMDYIKISVAAPKLWNNLPANIRTTSALESFKRKLKTLLFQDAFL